MCNTGCPDGSAGNTGYWEDPSLGLIMKFSLPGRIAQLALFSFQKWQGERVEGGDLFICVQKKAT